MLLLLTSSYIAGGLGPWWVERLVAGALELAALTLTVLATGVIRDRRAQAALAAGGLGAFGAVSGASDQGLMFGIASLVGAAVFAVMFVAVMTRVLQLRAVTIQTLFGAVCAYELLGFLFAGVYGGFGGLASRPFFGEPVDRSTYSYFSYVTLTTADFGAYTAQGGPGPALRRHRSGRRAGLHRHAAGPPRRPLQGTVPRRPRARHRRPRGGPGRAVSRRAGGTPPARTVSGGPASAPPRHRGRGPVGVGRRPARP
ncbi:MAG TPA: hypothetical protein VFN73_12050 [Propionibacteriaceae bacterium]|nr:hypothetical protein [Propionibacteriaceae bacterium]